jgi:DNA-binding response OmpR family regulator
MEKRTRVVLLDNDPATAEMYQIGLEANGFEVEVLNDPGQLRARLADGLPDLLILDYLLPGTTGVEIMTELRARPETADLPIFILSNHEPRGVEIKALPWLVKARTTPTDLGRVLAASVFNPFVGQA